MFLWTGRQVVFFLVMLSICAMALTHPAWAHWYHVIFPPLFIVGAVLAFAYVLRK
jgi:hypothetical protein